MFYYLHHDHGDHHHHHHHTLRRYRTKEPFVDLLRGSLQTFLNAMTWPDRTVYPVASQNNKDFYNLADVYLDVCFRRIGTDCIFSTLYCARTCRVLNCFA